MPPPVVNRVERLSGHQGETLAFFIRPGRRRGRWCWFAAADVPPFQGPAAWFEMARVPGGWTFIRQVDPRW